MQTEQYAGLGAERGSRIGTLKQSLELSRAFGGFSEAQVPADLAAFQSILEQLAARREK